MKKATKTTRETFRHGHLRRALMEAGLSMARSGGPEAVVLREATRQAGVTPNAAYRHFANQADLLQAVRSMCIARLAESIEDELARVKLGRDAQAYARRTLKAVGKAYLEFAFTEPGMFRTAFSVPPAIHEQRPENTAALGLNPFQLLSMALDRMSASGLLTKKERAGAEFLAWSTVHGLALLVLEGPLRDAPAEMVRGLSERLLGMVERGLTGA